MNIQEKITVLVIEDNKTVQHVIWKLLKASTIWEFTLDPVYNMTDALIKLHKGSYDIVLSDLELPDSTRNSTLKILKNEFVSLPFVILTATDDDELLLQSIEAGAQNYLCKDDLHQGALLSRSLYNAINHWKMKTQLKFMASYDELTSALNRRSFMIELKRTIDIAENLNKPFCLAICDLDNFRNINNSYGHIAGDNALKAFVSTIHKTIRNTDMMARFGGDEFCIIFHNTEQEKCQQYLNKLASIEIEIPYKNQPDEKITIRSSYGGTQFKKGMTPEELITLADKALYEVKENGKGFSRIL